MHAALLLLPDFSLILFGHALRRTGWLGPQFWSELEKLIYYVLFPALLFKSISRMSIDFTVATPVLAAAAIATTAGMLLSLLAKPLFRLEAKQFASGYQCGFRFNSYIGLAVAGTLYGEQGIALIGLVIGVLVPYVNAASVWMLARHGGGSILREIAKNPLIIATVGGIVFAAFQIPVPETAQRVLSLLASAPLALGLMAVGAGLRLSGGDAPLGAVAWWLAVKLVAVPAAAWAAGTYFGLDAMPLNIVVLFSMLPAATSAYILAVRMGGDGRIAALLISAGTLAAMVTMPIWLALLGANLG